MPFGLSNAPAMLQHLMERVLSGLHWSTCLAYLEDIIIFSSSAIEHLAEVLIRLQSAGLKPKPTKCHLLKKSVHYLGHVISEKGIETDPRKVKCILDWLTPVNSKELIVIDTASYYKKILQKMLPHYTA